MSERSHTVSVKLQGHSYDIVVGSALLATAPAAFVRSLGANKTLVVTDSNLASAALPQLVESFKCGNIEPIVCIVPAGETSKNVENILPIYDKFLSARIDRKTPLIALGGGVIGDMGGFVAATLLRGIPFIQIPTSLLAMVDASVGGKTGVNHTTGKNLIGAFHQPHLVVADIQTLKTLPERELRGGLAECIKHDIIRDPAHFNQLEDQVARALSLDADYLTDLVAHNVAIKARVVKADPFEKGERAHLNFGHTFGHAIETVSEYTYSHGECVALGMVAAAHAAERLNMIDETAKARIVNVIQKAKLPTAGLKLDLDQVIRTMGFDKKVAAGKLRFILPDRIGHVVIRDDVPPGVVRAAVESLR